MSLKIWHISDTHSYHNLLEIPEVDMVIFTGDCSNYRDIARNSVEVRDFLFWFQNNLTSIPHRIMIAGNHDSSIESGFISREEIEQNGVKYLYNEGTEVEGLKIWGSPFTPTYGEWSFMKKRGKLAPLWSTIPEGLDILAVHGPPKGILDVTVEMNGYVTNAGDKELWNEVVIKKPKYHLFGHIHNCGDVINAGVLKLSAYTTIFSNGSVVKDGKFGTLFSNGNIFEL